MCNFNCVDGKNNCCAMWIFSNLKKLPGCASLKAWDAAHDDAKPLVAARVAALHFR